MGAFSHSAHTAGTARTQLQLLCCLSWKHSTQLCLPHIQNRPICVNLCPTATKTCPTAMKKQFCKKAVLGKALFDKGVVDVQDM